MIFVSVFNLRYAFVLKKKMTFFLEFHNRGILHLVVDTSMLFGMVRRRYAAKQLMLMILKSTYAIGGMLQCFD